MARRKRQIQEINAGSMADIAFLLLIFFLVTTSIDSDRGIAVRLPPKLPKDQEPPAILRRNIWEVLINQNDELLVENEWMELGDLCASTKRFIRNPEGNPGLSESPLKAVVSIQSDKASSYGFYIAVHNELKRAYNELRDEYSLSRFGRKFGELPEEGAERQEVLKTYPQKISEAEPEDLSGLNVYK